MKGLVEENYNSQNLVSMWSDFIDWEKRRKGEDGFLVKQLKKHNCRSVFDSCLGDGADSIYLLKQGFDVTSNEIDTVFSKKAKENAKKYGVELKITDYDWRELDKNRQQSAFNAISCMGNSFTYIFDKKDQHKTLKNFYRLLTDGGILIIDERNYQYMLDNRKDILNGNFRYSKKYVYCGDDVICIPTIIEDNKIKLTYTDTKTKKTAKLIGYPFKKGELLRLLKEVGFRNIEMFSDYKPGFDSKADFYQYVCLK